MMAATEREKEIRAHAHRLAAAAVRAALNMWELDIYYPDQVDQDALEMELVAIARRLEKRGEPR